MADANTYNYDQYSKQSWTNYPDTSSPINAARLNHIETGIYDNSNNIRALDVRVQAIENMSAAEGSSF